MLDELSDVATRNRLIEQFSEATMLSTICHARLRTDWQLATVLARIEMDDTRARVHNTFTDVGKIIVRAMLKDGEISDCEHRIGMHRKQMGDFAYCLHCLLCLKVVQISIAYMFPCNYSLDTVCVGLYPPEGRMCTISSRLSQDGNKCDRVSSLLRRA